MPIDNYLMEKLRIAALPREQWKEALDALDPAIREAITPWLRWQWQIASMRQRSKKMRATPPRTSSGR